MTPTHCQGATCGRPFKENEHAYYRKYCSACYRRWNGAGRPESGPPAPKNGGEAGRATQSAETATRVTETLRLAGLGLARVAIARQVGVAETTIRKYLRDYRKAGGVIVMAGIETDVLRDIGPERSPAKTPALVVKRRWNGRDLDAEEAAIVTQAHQDALNRERAILPGAAGKVA